jgi:hypothetical protein
MSNVNIGQVALANSFNDWRIITNNLSNTVNELRNGNPFYKDNGGFVIANGVLSITLTSGTTLSVTANALIGGLITTTTLISTGAASFFDNVTLTGANSWLSGANVITSPLMVANSQMTINGYALITGLNTNAPFIATIGSNAVFNIANVVLVSNTGNMEIKGTVKFSNVNGTVNVANVLNVVGNTLFGTNANIAGTLNVVGGLFGTTANLTSLNVTGNIANTGNILITQNTVTGNLTITQNTSGGNVSWSQNISAGNLSITQNVTAGNASIGNVVITATANAVNVNVSGKLTVTGASNGEIDTLFLDGTHAYSIVNGNAVFNNLTVQGTQTVVGNTVSATDTLILRSGIVTAGNGQLIIEQGTTNGNAELQFVLTTNTWQVTANASNGFSTLLVASNIVDSVSNSSIINVGSANAVKWAYNTAIAAYGKANTASDTANNALAYGLIAVENIYPATNSAANTVATYANGTLTLANADLNFNNTATVNVSTTANGTGQVNIGFTVNSAAVGGAYQADVYANGTIAVTNGTLNFNNTSSISVSVTANGGQANIAFSTNTALSVTSISNKANAAYDIANTALAYGLFAQTTTYPTAIGAYVAANGALQRSGGTMFGNINFGVANVALNNPMLAGYKEAMTNVATINTPNTFTANGQITNVFDLTTGNTQFNCINVTFNGFATANQVQNYTLIVRQPANSLNVANLVNFTNTVLWSNAEVPVLTNLSGYLDILTFMTVDGGQTFYGAHSMANIA